MRGTLFLLCSVLCIAQDRADQIVEEEMRKQHIPGAAIAVLRDGRPLKLRGYGLANLEHGVPASAESVFKAGSIGKQFVAAGILILAEEGKLSLDDSIRKHLPDAPASWEPVTFRRLLSHTGGLIRNAPLFDHLKVSPLGEIVRSAYPVPLDSPAGEKWQYCNLCYFAAAEAIGRVSGKPWTEFLDERIFKPLGMTATRSTSFHDVVPHRAGGYLWKDERWSNADLMLPVSPSGGQLSTVIDLAKWDAALYTDSPISAAMKAEMWKPVRLNNGKEYGYGLGWELGEFQGHPFVRHTGSLTGFQGHFVRFLDDKLTVIVFANEAQAKTGAIANRLAEHYMSDIPAQSAVLSAVVKRAPKLPLVRTQIKIPAQIGYPSAVTMDDAGFTYILQRDDKVDPVLVLTREGKIVRSWGKGLFKIPHSIRIDPQGNIWTVDSGSSMVLKFTPQGEKLMEISVGEQPVGRGATNGTTDIAFGPNGRIFISDGYGNSRILEYTSKGERVKQWGSKGTGPGQFQQPHGIAVDDQGILYVADRNNARLQRFDLDGKYLGEWTHLGKVTTVAFRGGALWIGTQYRNEPNEADGWHMKIDRETGKILGVTVSGRSHHILNMNRQGDLLAGARPDIAWCFHAAP